MLFTGAHDCKIATLDLRSPRLLTAYWQVTSEVVAGLWNVYDPVTLIIATSDGLVSSLDLRMMENGRTLFQFVAHEGGIEKLTLGAMNPGLLAASGNDGTIGIWNISEHIPFLITTLEYRNKNCTCLKFFHHIRIFWLLVILWVTFV